MLLAGPKPVIPKCPGGTQDQGEAGGVLHQKPEGSCPQMGNALEKACFGAGGSSLTLLLLTGTTGMTGMVLGHTTAAPSVEPSWWYSSCPHNFILEVQETSERGKAWFSSVRAGGTRPGQPWDGARSRSDAGTTASSPHRRVRLSRRNTAG